MILLIVIPVWILAVSLIVGLCATARRGDIEHAAILAGRSWGSNPQALTQISVRRTRAADGRAFAQSGSAA
jgi:hypothetical protein